jgi:peroxiredoxin
MATERRHSPLAPGTPAPDFRLQVTPDQFLSLEECLGSPLVLVFYPLDFSPVCTDELAIFNELLPELKQHHGAQIIGISVDSVWCHLAFARDRHLRIPLLADFHPKGEMSRRYNAYRENDGFSERALYVIDSQGKIFWSYISPVGVNPGADGVLDALERLTIRSHEGEARV